jgi:hypothetical protein
MPVRRTGMNVRVKIAVRQFSIIKKGENISIISTVFGDIVELCAAKNSYLKKGRVIAKIKP